jgi:large subunit ribosomal protein L29
MKAKDMREKPVEDLRELEKSLVHDHFHAKLKNFTNRLDDTSSMRKLRKDVARVKTLLGELARGKVKATPAAAAENAQKKAAPKPAASKPAAKAKAAVPAASPSKPAESKPAKAPAKKAKAAKSETK